jgi:predicted nucleic acid-binding protein
VYTLEDIVKFRQKYPTKKRLVLDTNLLLLLLVGGCDKKLLKNYTSTRKYSDDDYDLLIKILRHFESSIVITPHILTEISNLSRRDIKEPQLSYYFKTVIDKLKNCKEEHIPLENLIGVKIDILSRFGFTDISIIEVAQKIEAVILTDDIALCLHATSLYCIPSINFQNIKGDHIFNNNKKL